MDDLCNYMDVSGKIVGHDNDLPYIMSPDRVMAFRPFDSEEDISIKEPLHPDQLIPDIYKQVLRSFHLPFYHRSILRVLMNQQQAIPPPLLSETLITQISAQDSAHHASKIMKRVLPTPKDTIILPFPYDRLSGLMYSATDIVQFAMSPAAFHFKLLSRLAPPASSTPSTKNQDNSSHMKMLQIFGYSHENKVYNMLKFRIASYLLQHRRLTSYSHPTSREYHTDEVASFQTTITMKDTTPPNEHGITLTDRHGSYVSKIIHQSNDKNPIDALFPRGLGEPSSSESGGDSIDPNQPLQDTAPKTCTQWQQTRHNDITHFSTGMRQTINAMRNGDYMLFQCPVICNLVELKESIDQDVMRGVQQTPPPQHSSMGHDPDWFSNTIFRTEFPHPDPKLGVNVHAQVNMTCNTIAKLPNPPRQGEVPSTLTLRGYADFLVRNEPPSDDDNENPLDYTYDLMDTKSRPQPEAKDVIQVLLYASIINHALLRERSQEDENVHSIDDLDHAIRDKTTSNRYRAPISPRNARITHISIISADCKVYRYPLYTTHTSMTTTNGAKSVQPLFPPALLSSLIQSFMTYIHRFHPLHPPCDPLLLTSDPLMSAISKFYLGNLSNYSYKLHYTKKRSWDDKGWNAFLVTNALFRTYDKLQMETNQQHHHRWYQDLITLLHNRFILVPTIDGYTASIPAFLRSLSKNNAANTARPSVQGYITMSIYELYSMICFTRCQFTNFSQKAQRTTAKSMSGSSHPVPRGTTYDPAFIDADRSDTEGCEPDSTPVSSKEGSGAPLEPNRRETSLVSYQTPQRRMKPPANTSPSQQLSSSPNRIWEYLSSFISPLNGDPNQSQNAVKKYFSTPLDETAYVELYSNLNKSHQERSDVESVVNPSIGCEDVLATIPSTQLTEIIFNTLIVHLRTLLSAVVASTKDSVLSNVLYIDHLTNGDTKLYRSPASPSGDPSHQTSDILVPEHDRFQSTSCFQFLLVLNATSQSFVLVSAKDGDGSSTPSQTTACITTPSNDTDQTPLITHHPTVQPPQASSDDTPLYMSDLFFDIEGLQKPIAADTITHDIFSDEQLFDLIRVSMPKTIIDSVLVQDTVETDNCPSDAPFHIAPYGITQITAWCDSIDCLINNDTIDSAAHLLSPDEQQQAIELANLKALFLEFSLLQVDRILISGYHPLCVHFNHRMEQILRQMHETIQQLDIDNMLIAVDDIDERQEQHNDVSLLQRLKRLTFGPSPDASSPSPSSSSRFSDDQQTVFPVSSQCYSALTQLFPDKSWFSQSNDVLYYLFGISYQQDIRLFIQDIKAAIPAASSPAPRDQHVQIELEADIESDATNPQTHRYPLDINKDIMTQMKNANRLIITTTYTTPEKQGDNPSSCRKVQRVEIPSLRTQHSSLTMYNAVRNAKIGGDDTDAVMTLRTWNDIQAPPSTTHAWDQSIVSSSGDLTQPPSDHTDKPIVVTVFVDFWAHSFHQEKQLFAVFLEFLSGIQKRYPHVSVYHYHTYEITALVALYLRYQHQYEQEYRHRIQTIMPDIADFIDTRSIPSDIITRLKDVPNYAHILLSLGISSNKINYSPEEEFYWLADGTKPTMRLIDLFGAVNNSLRTSENRLSLKNIEKLPLSVYTLQTLTAAVLKRKFSSIADPNNPADNNENNNNNKNNCAERGGDVQEGAGSLVEYAKFRRQCAELMIKAYKSHHHISSPHPMQQYLGLYAYPMNPVYDLYELNSHSSAPDSTLDEKHPLSQLLQEQQADNSYAISDLDRLMTVVCSDARIGSPDDTDPAQSPKDPGCPPPGDNVTLTSLFSYPTLPQQTPTQFYHKNWMDSIYLRSLRYYNREDCLNTLISAQFLSSLQPSQTQQITIPGNRD